MSGLISYYNISCSRMTIKQQFSDAVQRGTGEAWLILQNHPTINFSGELIKAAIKNYAYDAQAEGSRAVYVSALIALSKHQDKIQTTILQALATEQKDTWSLVQLFDLATIFAKQGNQAARKAIYSRFYKKVIPGADWCGYTAILELDGLEGLKYIAATIGKAMEKDAEIWADSSIIN